MSEVLRIISLGGGVQSSAMVLMTKHGLIEADVAVFADTGWEPWYVYDYLDYLEKHSAIPIVRIEEFNLKDDLNRFIDGETNRFPGIPLWIRRKDGKVGKLWRQCTYNYKVKPIKRFIRAEMKKVGAKKAELLLGITTDEASRAKDSGLKYLTHKYPLLEMGMSREDVIAWMRSNGYRIPYKSACIGCPFRSSKAIAEIAALDPKGYQEALELQERLARERGDFFKGTPFIFRPDRMEESLSCGFCEV